MPKSDFSKSPKADEIARVILFLCGDDAKLVHGAAIPSTEGVEASVGARLRRGRSGQARPSLSLRYSPTTIEAG